MATKPPIFRLTLHASTPWQKELKLRIKRGVKLLDTVTPGWFEPINPKTLAVSNRSFCVFAQAHHSFRKGIAQVAEKALAEGREVKLLENPIEAKKDFLGGAYRERRYPWLPSKERVLDVFYYGFDVTWEDAFTFGFGRGDSNGRHKRGSRREAFQDIDALWHSVVVQKKAHAEKLKAFEASRVGLPLQPNANFKPAGDWK